MVNRIDRLKHPHPMQNSRFKRVLFILNRFYMVKYLDNMPINQAYRFYSF